MSTGDGDYPAHNVFSFDGESVVFSSNFDNGNLARVERVGGKGYEFRIWTAADNYGTQYQSKHNAWFHFVVTGLPAGITLRIQIVNASPHSGLYKHDMRPVYRCAATNQKWCRIKSCVRVAKAEETSNPQLSFDHTVEAAGDKLFLAFTYPYTYSMVQSDLASMDAHVNSLADPEGLFWQRELVSHTRDGRRVELLTITSCGGADASSREPLLPGIFPESTAASRPPTFPHKDVIFISARVHPGEVPAQWTLKGMLNMLLDRTDLIARELLRRYVVKVVPMLNPDGVFRGHFRMDQLGQNLNRYYVDPDPLLQGPIYGAKRLLDYYAEVQKLSMYIDLHAHASKRGCFIYGNVMDRLEDQVQNMLFCRLIALNTPHFDYEGCLFSREHMTRIDPGDQAKGLTAEGSSRVATYLAHGIIHSYTLECNYNTAKTGNEVAATEGDPGGQHITQASPYVAYPEKFTPYSYAGVGRACLVALLDLRGQNPFSRIFRSKHKTLDRIRQAVVAEVKQRREYKNQNPPGYRRSILQPRGASPTDEVEWRRVVGGSEASSTAALPASAAPPVPPVPLTFIDYLPPDAGQDPTTNTITSSSSSSSSSSSTSASATASSARKVMVARPGLSIGEALDGLAVTGRSPLSSPQNGAGSSPPADVHAMSTQRSPRPVNVVMPGTEALVAASSTAHEGFGVRLKQPPPGAGNRSAPSSSSGSGGSGSGGLGYLPQRPDPMRGVTTQSSKSANGSRHSNILGKISRPAVAQFLLDPNSIESSAVGSVASDGARSLEDPGRGLVRPTGGEETIAVPMPLSSRVKLSSKFRLATDAGEVRAAMALVAGRDFGAPRKKSVSAVDIKGMGVGAGAVGGTAGVNMGAMLKTNARIVGVGGASAFSGASQALNRLPAPVSRTASTNLSPIRMVAKQTS